jgi:dipeptidyl aminopeptidase/acylaminoacyl peptidase
MRYITGLLVLMILTGALSGCQGAPAAQPPAAATSVPTEAPTATSAATATSAPTEAPAATSAATATSAPTEAPAATVTPAPTSAPSVTATSMPSAVPGAELLYLSAGALLALEPQSGAVRTLAEDVRDFAATPDGRRIALVRGADAAAEIWLIDRAGDGLRQLTSNDRVESDLSWAPDGQSLVYTAATLAPPFPPNYPEWSSWCIEGEARLYDLERNVEQSLGAGCQPAFGPDGRRIVFVSPPEAAAPGFSFTGARNAIRMVNRQGENAWSVASSEGNGGSGGLLVYAPSWAPGSGQLAYQRFLGYQALVDLNLTERSSSYERRPAPLSVGAGWALPPRYAPDGRRLAVVGHNYSDARGLSGYNVWSVTVLDLEGESQVTLPNDTLSLEAAEIDALTGATAAAWAPDGNALAVVLPVGWRPGIDPMDEAMPEDGPGELWLWLPGDAPPATQLADGLDYGTPLLWLPEP